MELFESLEDEGIDAVISDPPYGIDFQGADWDGRAIRRSARKRAGHPVAPCEAFQSWVTGWGRECHRVLKPGGHLLAFGAPRTSHRLACGSEDAGLEVRDHLMWIYGQGMPKSRRLPGGQATALKPACEPIVLARKPPVLPVAKNITRFGVGALNVDSCKVDGRFPANVVISHAPGCSDEGCAADCPARLIDASAELTRASWGEPPSRLFYCPKVTRAERDAGCERLPPRALDLFPSAQAKPPAATGNHHLTVKPLDLMRWLIRLAVPEDGLVLDPFCGSGSTGCAAVLEGRRFVGMELVPEYVEVAEARIAHWESAGPAMALARQARRGLSSRRRPAGRSATEVQSASPVTPLEVQVTDGDPLRDAVRLDDVSVEAVAQRVAELLAARPPAQPHQSRLLSATELAKELGVERSWVYEHAIELGGIRIGDGPRPRLRFPSEELQGRLERLSGAASAPDSRGSAGMPVDSVPLLPIHGQAELTSSSAPPADAGDERAARAS